MVKLANQDIWIRYKTKKDKESREELIMRYIPLVKYLAERVKETLPAEVDREDLASYGIFGLIDAIEKFDYNRGIKFETYAMPRIRGSIMDGLRAADHIPRSLRQKAKLLEKTYTELEHELGRQARDAEVAEAMGITKDELDALTLKLSRLPTISLDDFLMTAEDCSVTFGDMLEDKKTPNPQEEVELNELKEVLAEAIDRLSDQEKLVISLYYYEGLTLKETSEVIGLSESRISQIRTKAMLKLRGYLSNKF